MILLTTIVFIAFVLWAESHKVLVNFRAMKKHIYMTWGRADWVYPVSRQTQEWMRRNVKQSY
jgi:hypothetical protein